MSNAIIPVTDATYDKICQLRRYAYARGAHPTILEMLDDAASGHLKALDDADDMWVRIMRSPARAELEAA